jgi:hypothetical protein
MAQQFSRSVTLTSDLSTIAYGFRPTYIRIEASTANTAFLSFNSTQIATTASSTDSNSWQLTSGAPPLVVQSQGVERNGLSSAFTAIASTGSTTLIRVLAVRL